MLRRGPLHIPSPRCSHEPPGFAVQSALVSHSSHAVVGWVFDSPGRGGTPLQRATCVWRTRLQPGVGGNVPVAATAPPVDAVAPLGVLDDASFGAEVVFGDELVVDELDQQPSSITHTSVHLMRRSYAP
jgi:hypothetical protein